MRRLIIIASAISVLGLAAVAYAATQPFTGSIAFSSKKAGTASKPAPIGFTEEVNTTAPAGTRPPIQLEITLKIYGIKVDGKDFPTCSSAKIAAAHNDTVCPPKAMMANGYIRALLGSATDFSQPGNDCDPSLHVWNSGQGKQTYFFVTDATHQCLGGSLKTGSTPPYPGTYHMSGKYFIGDVKVPKYIDYPVPGLVGSLQKEHLVFSTQTTKVHGKTVAETGSFGCLKGKRPYTITTVTTGGSEGSQKVTTTIKGSAPCS